MGTFDNVGVYEFLGVPRSINAVGTGTVVGGSGPPDFVREKIEEASRGFVDMGLLLREVRRVRGRAAGRRGRVHHVGRRRRSDDERRRVHGRHRPGEDLPASRYDRHQGRGDCAEEAHALLRPVHQGRRSEAGRGWVTTTFVHDPPGRGRDRPEHGRDILTRPRPTATRACSTDLGSASRATRTWSRSTTWPA